eukprot:gene31181-40539_t
MRRGFHCGSVRFQLTSRYAIEDVACKFDFPSINLIDADFIKRVKTWIDDAVTINNVIRPMKETEATYDFFFILKDDVSTGARYFQLIEPTGDRHQPNEFFIARYLKKMIEVAESFAWNELGVDTSIDWRKEFGKKYSDRKMDRANLATFFGPMLNFMFSCCLDE